MKIHKPKLKDGVKMTRNFKRHSTKKTITIVIGKSRFPEIVRLNNIGMGGLSFHLDKKLRSGSIVYVRTNDPDQSCRLKAQVVWVKEDDGQYDIGITFSDPKFATRARILGSVL